jgi:gliding motility-associated-like protein
MPKTVFSDKINFHVNLPISATIEREKDALCGEDSVMLIAKGSGTHYAWHTTDAEVGGSIATEVTVKPAATTKYILKAYDADSVCSATDTVTIEVGNYIPVSIDLALVGRDKPEYCETTDSTFTFKAEPNNGGTSPTFIWYVNGEKQSETTEPTYTTTLSDGQILYCEMMASAEMADATCASTLVQSSDIRIVRRPLPVGTAWGDTTVCPGQPALLSASGGDAYEWTPAVNLSSDKIANPLATLTETTTFAVKIINEYGCFIEIPDAATVTILPTPQPLTVTLEASQDSLCHGEETSLRVSANYSGALKWYVDDVEQSATGATLKQAFANGASVYASLLVNNVTCLFDNDKRSNVYVVKTFAPPSVELAKRYDTICQFDTLEASATTSGKGLLWSPNYAINTTSGETVKLSPPMDYTYYVQGRIGNCLSIADTLRMKVIRAPENPIVNSDVLCDQNTTLLAVLNPEADVDYRWYLAENNGLLTTGVEYEAEPGDYVVVAVNANGCKNPLSLNVTVEEGVLPQALIGMPAEVYMRTLIPFANESENWDQSYASWRFSDTSAPQEDTAEIMYHAYANVGRQTVVLTVTNADGCQDTVSVQFEVIPQMTVGVWVPSAFKPSSSNAEDQVVKVYGETIKTVEFTIFTLDGRQVFSTRQLNHGWDGRYGGSDMPTGNYTYHVKAQLTNGQDIVKSGSVALIR